MLSHLKSTSATHSAFCLSSCAGAVTGVLMPIIFKGTRFWPAAFIVHLSLQILGALFIIAGRLQSEDLGSLHFLCNASELVEVLLGRHRPCLIDFGVQYVFIFYM